jgi:hypothetical protein
MKRVRLAGPRNRARSPWPTSGQRYSSRSVPGWLTRDAPCADFIGSWTEGLGPTTRPPATRGVGPDEVRSAGRPRNGSGRGWPSDVRCTEAHPPRASAARHSRPIGCWRSLSPFSLVKLSWRAWRRTHGKSIQLRAPGMCVERMYRLAAFAGGTFVSESAWQALLSRSWNSGGRARKPVSSAGRTAPVARARSLFSSRRIWPGSLIQKRRLSGSGSGVSSLAGVGAHSCCWRASRPFPMSPPCDRRLPAAFGRPPGWAKGEALAGGSQGCAVDSSCAPGAHPCGKFSAKGARATSLNPPFESTWSGSAHRKPEERTEEAGAPQNAETKFRTPGGHGVGGVELSAIYPVLKPPEHPPEQQIGPVTRISPIAQR